MPISGQNRRLFCPVWHWKTIDNLILPTSSFVHHFIVIGHFKLELQSGTPNSGRIRRFVSCVALRFNGWPWKIIWHLFYATSSYVHNLIVIGPFKLEFQSGNAKFGSKWSIFCPVSPCKLVNDPDKQIGHLIFTYFKHSTSFHSHASFQTRVTVRKRRIRLKIDSFCPVWL